MQTLEYLLRWFLMCGHPSLQRCHSTLDSAGLGPGKHLCIVKE